MITNQNTVSAQHYNRIEAARYLGVSVVTLDRALAARKIDCYRVARRVIFDKSHLDSFLSKNLQRAKN